MHPTRAYVLFSLMFNLSGSLSAATYVPRLLETGFTLSDVALINIWFWVVVSIAELPTGMWADGKSRGSSVKIGVLIYALGSLGYAGATDFQSALISEVLLGIALAFMSGAQQAWLTDALAKRGESDQLAYAFGSAAIARAVGAIVGGMISGLLGTVDLRLGWLAQGCLLLVAWIFSLSVFDDRGEPHKRLTELQAFRASFQAVRAKRSLLWSLTAAAIFGLVLPFNHYWTPYFRERVGSTGLSWIWVLVYASFALSGFAVRRIGKSRASEILGIIAAIIIAGAGLLAAGLCPDVAGAVFFTMVHEIGRGLFDPLLDVFTQRRVESGYRATFGSFQSLIGRAGFALVLVGIWLITRDAPSDQNTIAGVWVLSGSLLVLSAAVLWLFRPQSTK
ncbi:MAG: MFS transporter [bacterium]